MQEPSMIENLVHRLMNAAYSQGRIDGEGCWSERRYSVAANATESALEALLAVIRNLNSPEPAPSSPKGTR